MEEMKVHVSEKNSLIITEFAGDGRMQGSIILL